LPEGDVVIHDVLADEATGYAVHDELASGGMKEARAICLWLGWKGSALAVERLPGRSAYPPPGRLGSALHS
jgi:hypothetical protein